MNLHTQVQTIFTRQSLIGLKVLLFFQSEKEHKSEVSETLMATGSDGILKVFVSAVESPACFWVQVG